MKRLSDGLGPTNDPEQRPDPRPERPEPAPEGILLGDGEDERAAAIAVWARLAADDDLIRWATEIKRRAERLAPHEQIRDRPSGEAPLDDAAAEQLTGDAFADQPAAEKFSYQAGLGPPIGTDPRAESAPVPLRT